MPPTDDRDEPDLPKPPNHGPKLLLGMAVVMLVPLALIFVVFPRLTDQPFDRIDELAPDNIATLRVQILNRQQVDNGKDLGPYTAAPADYPALLGVLIQVPEVEEFTGARGPWLGEYRIVTKAGRKGTVRLYWYRPPGRENAEPRLRFQIGSHKFEGGAASAVIDAATAAAGQGR